MPTEEQMLRLGAALLIGLLIGLERGFQRREAPEGSRVLGIRTLGLIGLLGGLWGLLGALLGELLLGFAFVGVGLIIYLGRQRVSDASSDHGLTTVVAGMAAFSLGAMAVRGDVLVAAAAAVVTTVILSTKPQVHRWLAHMTERELAALLKLLIVSVVLLPVLPNRGFGPWQALNPFELWLMVVLIACISFAGYVAVRLFGEERGILISAFAGGLVSSTAVTLTYARVAARDPAHGRLLGMGIVVACLTMFPRILLVAGVVDWRTLRYLGLPLGLATLAAALGAVVLSKRSAAEAPSPAPVFENPLELLSALKFGAFLGVLVIATKAAALLAGSLGIYAVALASGVADVDAVTLSLARLAGDDLAIRIAAAGILIAAATNTVVKLGITAVLGGTRIAGPAALALGAGLAAGALGLFVSAALG